MNPNEEMQLTDTMIKRKKIADYHSIGNSQVGDKERINFNIHRGLSATGKGVVPTTAKDNKKLIFFTRPQLNFSDDNLLFSRRLLPLLENGDNASRSINRYIRCMLDPTLQYGHTDDITRRVAQPIINSSLVDQYNPFIPVLSNSLTNLTGWPDTVVPTKSSTPGIRKEVQSMVDGTNEIYGEFDLDATFINGKGEAALKMFNFWETIMTTNFANETKPYFSLLLENEIDYNTRIYVIILASDNKTIKRVACTGASFPTNDPNGKMFDYTKGGVVSSENNTFSIRFKSNGAIYNDPAVLQDFNDTMDMFNLDMANMHDQQSKRGNKWFSPTVPSQQLHNLVKVPDELLTTFDFNMYPSINIMTNELEWYVDKNNITTKQ